jgi:hypothetical protein
MYMIASSNQILPIIIIFIIIRFIISNSSQLNDATRFMRFFFRPPARTTSASCSSWSRTTPTSRRNQTPVRAPQLMTAQQTKEKKRKQSLTRLSALQRTLVAGRHAIHLAVRDGAEDVIKFLIGTTSHRHHARDDDDDDDAVGLVDIDLHHTRAL